MRTTTTTIQSQKSMYGNHHKLMVHAARPTIRPAPATIAHQPSQAGPIRLRTPSGLPHSPLRKFAGERDRE
jgi:hypothetical protein